MSTFPRSVWLSIAALGAILGLQTFMPDGLPARPPAAPPAAAGAPNVDFVSSSPIEITIVDGDSARTTILVRNDSDRDAEATLQPSLLDRRAQGFPSITASPFPITKRSVQTVPVTIPLVPPASHWWPDSRLPARGILILQASLTDANAMGSVSLRSRDLLVTQKQPSPAEVLVTGVGLVPAVLLALYGMFVSNRSNLHPSAEPLWSPQSWSTNLAIGGALVTSLVGVTALPSQTHYAARTTYTTLSAFFAALVVLAPAVYGLLKVDNAPSRQAALRMFAFAAAITVWGTIGQLLTAALLFLELSDARLVSALAAGAAAMVTAVVALLVAVYSVRAINTYLLPAGQAPGALPPPPPAAQPGAQPHLL